MPSAESPSRAYSNYNSWYIRDRSCIENVGGLPEDALNLMASDIYWKLEADGFRKSRSIVAYFIFSLSLAPTSQAEKFLDKIEIQAKEYSQKFEPNNVNTPGLIKTDTVLTKIIRSYKDCLDKSKIKKNMNSFVTLHQNTSAQNRLLRDIETAEYFKCK